MAEITYIPYGEDSQIDLNALQQDLANEYENYLNSRYWAKPGKRKNEQRRQQWMDYYNNVMSQGITGASVVNGRWRLNHNGEEIKYGNPMEQEMAEDMAHFVVGRMANLASKKQEEKKDENKETYDFLKGFNQDFLNRYYGGNPELYKSEWFELDPRNEKGFRGTEGRRKQLIEGLEKYRDSLEDKYNYEGTPFSNFDDVKTRINDAITALNSSDESDDIPALNKLGFNYRAMFSNGANDVTRDSEGNEVTYQQLYDNQQAKLKQEAEAKQKQQQQAAAQARANQYTRFRFFGDKLHGKPLSQGKDLNYLNGLGQKGNLTIDEQSEIVGAFKLAARNNALQNLSKEELAKFGSRYANTPNRLKKINGLNGLYWDSVGNRVIQPYNASNALQVDFNQILQQNSPEYLAQQKLNTPRGGGVELTDADKRDITATLLDLGAFVNPEVFSGTAMALGASGARTWNSIEERGIWDTLTDWKTWIDWGTGALGGTAFLGDASSVVKFAKGLGKLMTIPAVINAVTSIPEAKQAWDKIDTSSIDSIVNSVKKLTPQDYHAISNVLVGALSGKNYIKGNLAERKVLQESGFNTQAKTKIKEYANKYGLTRTKVSTEANTPTIKAKVNGKDQEIEINPETKAKIEKRVNEAGNNKDARNKAVQEELEAAGKINKGDNVEVSAPSKFRDSKYSLAKVRTTKNLFSSSRQPVERGADNFENWLNNRSLWDQYKPWSYGTNRNMRRMRTSIFGKDTDESGLISSGSEESPYAKKPLEQGEIKKSANTDRTYDPKDARNSEYNRAIMNRYQKVMDGKFSNKEMQNTGKEPVKIGDEDVRVYTTRDAKGNNAVFNITVSGKSHNFKTQEEAKKFIASLVKAQKNNIVKGKINKENIKEIGKILQDLKRRGWLKQGGQINLDKTISNCLKNYEL